MMPYNRIAIDHWGCISGLSFEAKAIYIYLLTCTHRTAAQAFHIPDGYIAADTGATNDQIVASLEELFQAGLIMREGDAVLLLDGHRHDPAMNWNGAIHRIKLWRDGALPKTSKEFEIRTIECLVDALESEIVGWRAPEKNKGIEQRRSVYDGIDEMVKYLNELKQSDTVSEPFANCSQTVSDTRVRDDSDNISDNVREEAYKKGGVSERRCLGTTRGAPRPDPKRQFITWLEVYDASSASALQDPDTTFDQIDGKLVVTVPPYLGQDTSWLGDNRETVESRIERIYGKPLKLELTIGSVI